MNVEPELLADFLSSLGLSVRTTNVLRCMGVNSFTQLLALDTRTLLRRRNCGKKTAEEIMQVAVRYKASVDTTAQKQDLMTLSSAQENTPVAHLRLSVRARNVLEVLQISTVGQLARASDRELLRVQNFGKTSLREVRSKLASFISREYVVWPAEEQSSGKLNGRITRAARKVQRLRNTAALSCDDPRFGNLICEMGLGAANLREAANMIVSRKSDPVNPRALIQLLVEAHGVVGSSCRMTLEAELFSLTEGCGKNRDRRIITSYMGWDGRSPRTLGEVGQEYGMTRERVRQICNRVNTRQAAKLFLPVLDRALKITTTSAPAPVEEIEDNLLRHGLTKGKFSIEGICSAARALGREVHFTVEKLHGHCFVIHTDSLDLLNRVDHFARRAISHWGVATVDDIAAATGTTPLIARKVLVALTGFNWLDESTGWFWIANVPRNALLNQIRKILAVSPNIDVGELRTGVGRHHRRKGFAPPRRVLLELCRQLPWCRVVGDKITAAELLSPDVILSDSEQTIFQVLKEHGPVMQRPRFEELCLKAGVNHHSFWIFLSYCPIITRYAPGVYGLRGADMPAGLVESLIPKPSARSKLLIDYGWVKDQQIQVVYKVSSGMLSNGIVSIPSALKNFLQGRFVLKTADNSNVGTLVVSDKSGWGLGPLFTRRGGEVGDYLSLAFDLSKQEAMAQIGDASLIDELGDSAKPSTQNH